MRCTQVTVLLSLLALIASGLHGFAAGPAAGASKQRQCWVIDQNLPIRGRYVLTLAADAVRASSPTGGYTFICCAPDWHVHCFRESEKLEWQGSLESFDGTRLANPTAVAKKRVSVTKVMGIKTVAGQRCTAIMPDPANTHIIYLANDIKVAKPAAEFVNRFYCLVDTGKIPISSVECRTPQSAGKTILETTKCRQELVAANIFDLPKQYKQTKTMPQVVFSLAQKDEMSGALMDIGFRSNIGKNKP